MFKKMATLLALLFLMVSSAWAGPQKRAGVPTKLEPAPAPPPVAHVPVTPPPAPAVVEPPPPQIVCGWRTSTHTTIVPASTIQVQGMAVPTCHGTMWLNGTTVHQPATVIPGASLSYQCEILTPTK